MAKITVMDWQILRGTRMKVYGVVVYGGGRETFNPADVKLRTVDFIMLTSRNIAASGGVPVGSLSLKGSSAGISRSQGVLEGRGGDRGVGSPVTLIWAIGSSNTDTKLGSVGFGSKAAYFEVIGEL